MDNPFAPLTDEEFHELDMFLLFEVESDESMTIDTFDGYLHAIAIGPTTLHPKQWLPKVWGLDTFMPPMESIEHLNHILGLVMRHFNGIIAGLEDEPSDIYPAWSTRSFEDKEYDDAEGWAYGFVEGMKLCWDDWKPMLDTPEGKAWYRPIGLLGEDDFGPDQDRLTKTPAQRAKLALQIPEAVLAMHAYWLPLRQAVYEKMTANVH